MNHNKKRVYDFFKYCFNKLCRNLLESDTGMYSYSFPDDCGRERNVAFPVWFGENVTASDADRSTAQNVPPVVFVTVRSGPRHVSR